MAKIPSLGGPKQIRGPGRAPGVRGGNPFAAAVGELGGVIQGLGFQLLEKQQRSEAADYTSTNFTDMRLSTDDVVSKAKLTFTGDRKGYAAFVDESLEEDFNERIANAPNQKAADALKQRSENFRARAALESRAFETASATKFRRNNYVEESKAIGLGFFEQPDPEESIMFMAEEEEEIKKRIGVDYTEEEANALIKDRKSQVVNGNVYGLMEMGQFESARMLVTSNFGESFGDPQTAVKTTKIINDRQLQSMNRDANRISKELKNTKILQEKQDTDTLRKIITAELTGDSDAEELANEAFLKGRLSYKGYKSNIGALNRIDARNDKNLEFTYRSRLVSGESPQSVMETLQRDVAENRISSEAATGILKAIETKGSATTPTQRRNMKNADRLLKSSFVNPIFTTQDAMKDYAQAGIERDDLIEKGVDPVDATRAIIRKYKGTLASIPLAPGIPSRLQSAASTPEQVAENFKLAAAEVKQSLDRKEITREEAVKIGKTLNDRRKAIEAASFPSVQELEDNVRSIK